MTHEDSTEGWVVAPSPGDAKLPQVHFAIMGHVDAGKTSLVSALNNLSSGILSTAALDKHPQSKARGITLDLGNSSFVIKKRDDEAVQQRLCLVDCPGHNSLMSTVLVGSAVVDTCLLVLDINVGMQQQTAECFAICEIMYKKLICVFTKVDKLTGGEDQIQKKERALRKAIEKASKLKNDDLFIVSTSAPTGHGLDKLLDIMGRVASQIEKVSPSAPPDESNEVVFAYDHQFGSTGHGTVLTGLLLKGSIKPGDTLCGGKVRSIQTYRLNLDYANAGMRIAMCIPKYIGDGSERGLLVEPSSLASPVTWAVGWLKLVPKGYRATDTTIANKGKQAGHKVTLAAAHKQHDAEVFFLQTKVKYSGNFDRESLINYDNERQNNLNEEGEITLCLIKMMNLPNLPLPLRVIGIYPSLNHEFRIAMEGIVEERIGDIIEKIGFTKTRKKECTIKRHKEGTSYIIEANISNLEHANTFIGDEVSFLDVKGYTKEVIGTITATFGKKGLLIVEIPDHHSNLELIGQTGTIVTRVRFNLLT